MQSKRAMIRDLGGELWRIDRPGVSYDGDHISKGALEDITPIDQLKEKIYG